MSEFTNTKDKRLAKLLELAHQLLETGNALSFINSNKAFIPTVVPTDFIALFDTLITERYKIEALKSISNKVINIFYTAISEQERIKPDSESFLGVLEQNNAEMEATLISIRPTLKAFLKDTKNNVLKDELTAHFKKLEVFGKYYTIKENVLFPIIEKTWSDYRCLQIMWSFHDDIRQNIKTVIGYLESGEFDIKKFNRCIGFIFFNMHTIKFREEFILFPYILSTISSEQLQVLNKEGFEMGYPYIQPLKPVVKNNIPTLNNGLADLSTGTLSVEQIKLIFNHLPVDITYVDENDKVLYFSTPKKRIFPRTTAILGREVSNCHPPESVHVVEEIVESFKNRSKDNADFWIRMKGEYILIQYFAVRNEDGQYKGVIEVSQEISDIQAIEGEKRLLDW